MQSSEEDPLDKILSTKSSTTSGKYDITEIDGDFSDDEEEKKTKSPSM